MTDLHYKMFKLTSGETIVCMTDDDCENLFDKKTICILDPVLVTNIRLPKGDYLFESFMLTPWLSFSDQPIYDISTVSIILSSDIKDSLKNNYVEFVNKSKQETPKNDQQDIEEFFQELEEGLENEEEIEIPGGSRVLH